MSDNFIVSARKYRPVIFEDVVGQESVTTTLKNAIKSGQLAHAYLFCGPRGVGKTTCARILAREVNEFKADESGDVSTSLNIYELDAASNNSVEDIRSLVDQVRIPPQYGKYKVYIIDEVHMLSSQAFNAFLKTLEEPPHYAIFILATTEKHKILPTIISSCQIFDCIRITIEDIAKHLGEICKREKIKADESALHVIAQKADGALRDALSMLDRLVNYTDRRLEYDSVLANLNILDYDYYFRITDQLIAQNHSQALLLFDEIIRKGFDGGDFIAGLAEHFRNLMVSKEPETVSLLEVTGSLKERYLQQATLISPSYLLNALNLANLCEVSYKASSSKRLHVELTLIKMCHLSDLLKTPPQDFFAEPKKNAPPQQIVKKETAPQVAKKVEEPERKYESSAVKEPKPEELKKNEAPVSKPRSSSLTGSLRFSDLNVKDEDAPKKETDGNEKIAVDPTALEQAWSEYIKILEEEKRLSLHSLMSQNKPTVEESVISVTLNSKLQKELFDNERMKLVAFLEDKMNVRGISLMAVVTDKPLAPPPKPFTAQEKFRKMAEENPAVLDLQKRLDLKLEH